MKRLRGSQTDPLRPLLRGGLSRPRPAEGPSPHIEVPPDHRQRPPEGRPGDPRARLIATLERWSRLDAPLPEELIRRGLIAMDVDLVALREALHFDDRGYQRTRIYQSRHFEALVLCWRPGQGSPIHDHRGSTCGLFVVRGTATETVFESTPCGRLVPTRSNAIPERVVAVSRGGDVHSVANLQGPGADLVSLHVYSPPLVESRCYRLAETVFGGHDEDLDGRSPTRTATI